MGDPPGYVHRVGGSVVDAPAIAHAAMPAGEHPNTPLLRALVLRVAAMSGSAEVIRRCLRLFDEAETSIPADLRALVYNTTAAEGGEERWLRLRAMVKSAASSEEQRRVIAALGRAKSPALLSSALDMLLGEHCARACTSVEARPTRAHFHVHSLLGVIAGEEVRSQDAVFVVAAVASNPGDAGRNLAWIFLKENWAAVHKRYGGGEGGKSSVCRRLDSPTQSPALPHDRKFPLGRCRFCGHAAPPHGGDGA